MSSKEEDKYFQQLEKERSEQLRRERELEALQRTERAGIAESLQTSEEIAAEALELGFSAETSRVLPLMPLIQVAWADGSVSVAEEKSVLELAEARGIKRGTASHELLTRLLVERPAPLFFERVNRVIAHLIQSEPSSWIGKTIPELCREVADASGGFFGLGNRINDEEQALLDELTQRFGAAATQGDVLPIYTSQG